MSLHPRSCLSVLLFSVASACGGGGGGSSGSGTGPQDPVVSFGSTAVQGTESGGPVLVPLQLSSVAATDVLVPIRLAGIADDSDFSLQQNPVTIPAGSITADVVILPVADVVAEGNEEIQLSLGRPT